MRSNLRKRRRHLERGVTAAKRAAASGLFSYDSERRGRWLEFLVAVMLGFQSGEKNKKEGDNGKWGSERTVFLSLQKEKPTTKGAFGPMKPGPI